jgi:hypothetical protein
VDGDMTHTEESLMALADGMAADYSDRFAPAGVARDALRLAIREVLEERDALAMQVKLKPAPMADCPVYCKTAADLQAECERLRTENNALRDAIEESGVDADEILNAQDQP